MKLYINKFRNEEQGQDLVEYALGVGMIAVAAVAAMPGLSSSMNTIFSKIASIVASAMG